MHPSTLPLHFSQRPVLFSPNLLRCAMVLWPLESYRVLNYSDLDWNPNAYHFMKQLSFLLSSLYNFTHSSNFSTSQCQPSPYTRGHHMVSIMKTSDSDSTKTLNVINSLVPRIPTNRREAKFTHNALHRWESTPIITNWLRMTAHLQHNSSALRMMFQTQLVQRACRDPIRIPSNTARKIARGGQNIKGRPRATLLKATSD